MTYLPVIYFYYKERNSKKIGENNISPKNRSNISSIKNKIVFDKILFMYLALHRFIFMFLNLRYHMLLTIFKSTFNSLSIEKIAILASIGVLFSLLISFMVKGKIEKNELFYFKISCLLLTGCGFLISNKNFGLYSIPIVSFIFSEFTSFGLSVQRKIQTVAENTNSLKLLVFFKLVGWMFVFCGQYKIVFLYF